MVAHASDTTAASIQTRIWREKSPGEKIRLTALLWKEARNLKRAMIRHSHPEWEPVRVEDAVRKAMNGERG